MRRTPIVVRMMFAAMFGFVAGVVAHRVYAGRPLDAGDVMAFFCSLLGVVLQAITMHAEVREAEFRAAVRARITVP